MWEHGQVVGRRVRLGAPVFGDAWGGTAGALLLPALLGLTIGGSTFGPGLVKEGLTYPHGQANPLLLGLAALLTGAALVVLVALPALVLRFPRAHAGMELLLRAEHMEWVRPRRWWLPKLSYTVPWNRVQAVRATTAVRPGGPRHRVMDVYLFVAAARVPQWLGAVDPPREEPAGMAAPAARIRLGGPWDWAEEQATEAAIAIDRVRPDIMRRDTPPDSWFTPGRDSQGSDRVWVDFQVSPARWSRVALLWLGPLALFSVSLVSDLWYPLIGGLSAIPWAVCLVGLSVWLYQAPRSLSRRGVQVDGEGLTFIQEGALWLRHRGMRVHVPWPEVLFAADGLARGRYQPGVPAEPAAVIDIYLTQADRAGRWLAMGAQYTETLQNIGRADLSLPTPVSWIQLDLSGQPHDGGASWHMFGRTGAPPREVPAGDLLRAISLFRPDLVR